MGILDEDVARVRETADLVALVTEQVALRKVGRRYQGLCPFHQEKTPSFSVNPELGLYYCFGCGARGDAISFVRATEHLDFAEAVERLAGRFSIPLRYDDVNVGKQRRRRDRLIEAAAAALEVFHRRLLDAADAGDARRYLRSRGFDGEVARQFSLGWAPEGFDTVSAELQRRGFDRSDLVDAGLSFVNRANRLQDHFRSRVIFPIFDQQGLPVAFGGRALGGDGPKYKNSPETPIYQKSRTLYGLNWAKGEIVARDAAIVCEGYTDVIALNAAGERNAVATCGTALTEDHVRKLASLTRNLVLAFDADAAGQAAAERFFQWEQAHDLRLGVADLPGGRDPAEVWLDDPEALVTAIHQARPFLEFRIGRALDAGDLTSLEGRAHVAERTAALVAEHPSDLVRDQYAVQLGERLEVDADAMREAVTRARRNPTPAPAGPPGRAAAPPERGASRHPGQETSPGTSPDPSRYAPPRAAAIDRSELEGLRLALHEPHRVGSRLDPLLFDDALVRGAYELLASTPDARAALDAADPPTRELLERVAVEEPFLGDDADAAVTSVVVQLAEQAGRRRLEALVRAGDDRASELKQRLDDVVTARSTRSWADADRAAQRLVAWVAVPTEEQS